MTAESADTLLHEVKGALVFNHAMAMQAKIELLEARISGQALLELLAESGHVTLEALARRMERQLAWEWERLHEGARVEIGPDEPAGEEPDIDCAARLRYCGAGCCKLRFPLNRGEVEAGIVEWDLLEPYLNRRRGDGYCVHNGATSRGCAVYDDRPVVCRTYDCRQDPRIWIDFDRWIPTPPDRWSFERFAGYRAGHEHGEAQPWQRGGA